mgnify:CR=1 FL=1
MLRLGLILMLALSPVAVFAQDKAQTLADIRAELDALIASGWPDAQCPDPNAPPVVAPVAEPTKRRRAASAES